MAVQQLWYPFYVFYRSINEMQITGYLVLPFIARLEIVAQIRDVIWMRLQVAI